MRQEEPAPARAAHRLAEEPAAVALGIGGTRRGDGLIGHGEDVGRRGEEGERDVAPAALEELVGEVVDGGADPHVEGPVGVDVVAEHEVAAQVGDPRRDRGQVVEQIETRPLREILEREALHVGGHTAAGPGPCRQLRPRLRSMLRSRL